MRNFPAKTLRNYHDMFSVRTSCPPLSPGMSSLSCANPCPLVPTPCGLPHSLPHLRSASPSDPAGRGAQCRPLRPLSNPSESPPSPSWTLRLLPQPARCIPCPSPTTVGQHGGKSQRRNSHVFMDHMGAACPESACHLTFSLTILSIVKLQKIVNTVLKNL